MSDKQQYDIHNADLSEFVNEFTNESDRASAIIGAAKLDYLLYQCLSKFLLPNPSNNDPLFDGEGPLSSFSSKINIAYRLGLISPQASKSLHLVRRIRNTFAHEAIGCNFDSGAHRDRVIELVASFRKDYSYEQTKGLFVGKSGASVEFLSALAIMVMELQDLFNKLEQLDNSKAKDFIFVSINNDEQKLIPS